jgi:hypothetical protein
MAMQDEVAPSIADDTKWRTGWQPRMKLPPLQRQLPIQPTNPFWRLYPSFSHFNIQMLEKFDANWRKNEQNERRQLINGLIG